MYSYIHQYILVYAYRIGGYFHGKLYSRFADYLSQGSNRSPLALGDISYRLCLLMKPSGA